MKIPIDSLFHGKISDFMKIHEILKKHPERYNIGLKNIILVIFLTNTPNGRRLSFENWLKSVIFLKLAYFMNI